MKTCDPLRNGGEKGFLRFKIYQFEFHGLLVNGDGFATDLVTPSAVLPSGKRPDEKEVKWRLKNITDNLTQKRKPKHFLKATIFT